MTDARELAELISSDDAVPGLGLGRGCLGVVRGRARRQGCRPLGGLERLGGRARPGASTCATGCSRSRREDARGLRDRARRRSTSRTTASRRRSSWPPRSRWRSPRPLPTSPLLAADATERADGASRADAAAAAALAAGAARAAAKLVAINLSTQPGDERIAAAERAVEAADDAARQALAAEI